MNSLHGPDPKHVSSPAQLHGDTFNILQLAHITMLCICVCVCLQMLTFETLLVKELQKQQSRAEFCDIVLQTRGLTKYIFSLIFFSHLSLRLLYFLHPVQACLCRCTAVCCLPSVLGSVGLCQPCHHPETDRGD